MKKWERVAQYNPFISLLEANGVMSKAEQLAIAKMAVKALKSNKEIEKVIKEHLTFDRDKVQEVLDLEWLKNTDGETLSEDMCKERKNLALKYGWKGKLKNEKTE